MNISLSFHCLIFKVHVISSSPKELGPYETYESSPVGRRVKISTFLFSGVSLMAVYLHLSK